MEDSHISTFWLLPYIRTIPGCWFDLPRGSPPSYKLHSITPKATLHRSFTYLTSPPSLPRIHPKLTPLSLLCHESQAQQPGRVPCSNKALKAREERTKGRHRKRFPNTSMSVNQTTLSNVTKLANQPSINSFMPRPWIAHPDARSLQIESGTMWSSLSGLHVSSSFPGKVSDLLSKGS